MSSDSEKRVNSAQRPWLLHIFDALDAVDRAIVERYLLFHNKGRFQNADIVIEERGVRDEVMTSLQGIGLNLRDLTRFDPATRRARYQSREWLVWAGTSLGAAQDDIDICYADLRKTMRWTTDEDWTPATSSTPSMMACDAVTERRSLERLCATLSFHLDRLQPTMPTRSITRNVELPSLVTVEDVYKALYYIVGLMILAYHEDALHFGGYSDLECALIHGGTLIVLFAVFVAAFRLMFEGEDAISRRPIQRRLEKASCNIDRCKSAACVSISAWKALHAVAQTLLQSADLEGEQAVQIMTFFHEFDRQFSSSPTPASKTILDVVYDWVALEKDSNALGLEIDAKYNAASTMPRSPEGPADIKALLEIPFSFENQAWITRTLNMTFLMAFQVNDFIVKRTMRKEFLHAAKTGRPTLNPRRDVVCAAQDLTSALTRLLKSDSFLVRQLISNIRDRLVWVNALGDMQHLLDALVLIHQGEPPNSAEAALAFMGRFDFLFDDPSNFDLTVLAFDFHPHEPFAAELPYKGALLLWEVSKAAAIHALLFLYCAWVPKFDNTLVDMLAVLVLYVLLETVLRSRRSWVELWDYSTDYPDSRDVREAEDALVRLQLHARHLVLGWQMLQYVGRSMMVLTSPETLRPALPGQMRSDVMDETGAHVDCIGCELDAALSNLPAVDADAIRTLSEERYPIMREGRDNARG